MTAVFTYMPDFKGNIQRFKIKQKRTETRLAQ